MNVKWVLGVPFGSLESIHWFIVRSMGSCMVHRFVVSCCLCSHSCLKVSPCSSRIVESVSCLQEGSFWFRVICDIGSKFYGGTWLSCRCIMMTWTFRLFVANEWKKIKGELSPYMFLGVLPLQSCFCILTFCAILWCDWCCLAVLC